MSKTEFLEEWIKDTTDRNKLNLKKKCEDPQPEDKVRLAELKYIPFIP